METISADIVRYIALKLSHHDVISISLVSKNFKRMIYESEHFWRNKIQIDFPKQKSFLEAYEKFRINNTLNNYEIYKSSRMDDNVPATAGIYKLLNAKSKIIRLEEDDFPELYEEYIRNRYEDILPFIYENIAKNITKHISKKFIVKNNLKRGDVLHLKWGITWDDTDIFLWDGEKTVMINYNHDGEIEIPEEFSFPEFRPDYFSDSIITSLVRLSPDKVKEITDNFDVNTQTSYITDKYNKYTISLHHGIGVDIQFNKIFPKNFLVFDNFILLLEIPNLEISASGDITYYMEEIEFYPEWKEAIKNIVPKNGSVYHWEHNTLVIKSNY